MLKHPPFFTEIFLCIAQDLNRALQSIIFLLIKNGIKYEHVGGHMCVIKITVRRDNSIFW